MKEKKDYEFTYGFTDNMQRMKKANVLKALNKKQLYNDVLRKRKDFILMKVKDGWTVGKDKKGKGVLEKGLNSYSGLTKTELDYAYYLVKLQNK
ncbi:MAG: hypothetical protein PHX21_13840 [bacterium]|nr:hypothetical protein [bacterium]